MSRLNNSRTTKKGNSSGLKRTLSQFFNGLRSCKRNYPTDLSHLHMAELWAEKWELKIEESTQKKRRSKSTCLETIPEEQEYDEELKKAMVNLSTKIQFPDADFVVIGDKSSPLRPKDRIWILRLRLSIMLHFPAFEQLAHKRLWSRK